MTHISSNHKAPTRWKFVVVLIGGGRVRYFHSVIGIFCFLRCVKDESAEMVDVCLMASDACSRSSMRVVSEPAGWKRRDSYIVWSHGAGRRCM